MQNKLIPLKNEKCFTKRNSKKKLRLDVQETTDSD